MWASLFENLVFVIDFLVVLIKYFVGNSYLQFAKLYRAYESGIAKGYSGFGNCKQ